MLNLPFIRAIAENQCGTGQQIHSNTVATAALVLFGLALGWAGTAWAKTPTVSEPAPDFVLKSFAGRNLRLSEFRGDVVIINFWSANCGRCRDQLNQLAAINESNRLSILSVNVDSDSNVAKRVIADQGFKFPVLLDTDKIVSRLYDPSRLPMAVMVDPHGTIRYIHEGYKRGDEAQYALELAELLAE